MTPAVSAEKIVKRYGKATVLDLDRLVVEPGRIVAVAGPNGAGKTTLLEILALLVRPASGRLSILGEDVFPSRPWPLDGRRARALRGRVTMVLDKAYLFHGTARDNVRGALAARHVAGPESDRRAAAALEALGASGLSGRDARTLSAGERQRVAVARAIAIEPEVLLLDEPTVSIDPAGVPLVEELLRRLARERGTTVIFSTHDPAQASRLADEMLLLESGRKAERAAGDS